LNDEPRRLIDRIRDHNYLDDLDEVAIGELRARRAGCAAIEADISYGRRLVQGRLDILRHELNRRAGGGQTGIEELVSKLPQILADDVATPPTLRHTPLSLPRDAEKKRREIEKLISEATLSRIDTLSPRELEEIAVRLTEAEAQASRERREILDVLERLDTELVKRLQADPSAILESPRR
jgi:hypothetical protein